MAFDSKRTISDHFVADLKSGILSNVLQTALNRNCLLCIRDNYVNLYHKGHNLFKIEPTKRPDGYRLIFNFNHARFTQNHELIRSNLEQAGCEVKDTQNGKGRTLVLKITRKTVPSLCKIEQIITTLQQLIDDFFDETKLVDFFKEENSTTRKKESKLEKQRQHEIMLANRNLENGYFVYDMEFAQSRDSIEDDPMGRFDLLALRSEKGKPQALVFIELKSTLEACALNSGVDKHKADLRNYLSNLLSIHRITEMGSILNTLKELAIIQDLIPTDYSNIQKEILFAFTDEAKKYKCDLSLSERINLDAPFILLQSRQ